MPKAAKRHTLASSMRRHHRVCAARRGYDRTWKKLRMMKLGKDPMCETPGCVSPATHVDHIIAIKRGGSNRMANLQSLCQSCHSRKTCIEDGGFGHPMK